MSEVTSGKCLRESQSARYYQYFKKRREGLAEQFEWLVRGLRSPESPVLRKTLGTVSERKGKWLLA